MDPQQAGVAPDNDPSPEGDPASVASGGRPTEATPGEIVVGMDLSFSSLAALHWAARYARNSGARLRAVHARQAGPATWSPGMAVGAYVIEGSLAALDQEMKRVFTTLDPEPDWSLEFVAGSPAAELIRASEHAELLVIGTQEHTGLGRLLVGSVSHYCLAHARCPMVAVPWLGSGPGHDGASRGGTGASVAEHP